MCETVLHASYIIIPNQGFRGTSQRIAIDSGLQMRAWLGVF